MKLEFTNIALRHAALGAALLTASHSFGQVLGIEADADVAPLDSQAPTGLFGINTAGVVSSYGNLTTGGVPDHFDGLAYRSDNTVWCFRQTGAGSQLCQVNTTTLACVPVGGILPMRNVRGACFEASGRLFAIDVQFRHLLEVSTATGAILGSAPLHIGAASYAVTTSCDISFTASGMCLTDQNRFYQVGPLGGMANINTDGVAGTDGFIPSNGGLAQDAAGNLITLDSNNRDDIYRYNPSGGWGRNLVIANVIPAISSGRGDLASAPQVRLVNGNLVVVGGGGNPDGYNPWNWRLKDPQTGTTVWQGTFNVNGQGNFQIPMDFAGQFVIEIDHPIACSRSRPITIANEGPTVLPVAFGMVVGDVNGSGEIDAIDIDIVIANFGNMGGLSDVNNSGEVDAVDIDIVIGNFGAVDE